MEIAVPVMAVCLVVTTTEVNDGNHSTVAYQEIKACTICNTKDCPKPEWFDDATKIYTELNKPVPGVKPKRKAERKRR